MKKIVAINDLSGIGRCSLSVALPIISSLKVQCCPFPTSVLSSQTNYPEFSFLDLTSEMRTYYKKWIALNLNIDSIYTGFLGSSAQIDIVLDFIKENSHSLVLVDPILGDNGELYPIFDDCMCTKIKNLVRVASVTTPNLTEACILTNRDYNSLILTKDELVAIAKDISNLGPDKVVITGIVNNNTISNLAYDKTNDSHFFISTNYNHKSYSGTGDIFASILSALLTKSYDFELAVKTATSFISSTITYTSQFDTDTNDGVMFENFLHLLTSID